MAKKFFSVIITTYNRANLLRITLKSLKRQTFRDFEAFIIDDASTDNTPDVFKEFSAEGNWCFMRLKENKGYPFAKNLVLRKCNCEYVTFLDSDDIWLPERLEEFYKTAKTNPEVGFIFSDGYILSGDVINSTMFSYVKQIPEGRVPAYYAVSNKYLPYVTTNVAIKMDAILKTGFYREDLKMLGDTEYFARVIANYPVAVIKKPLSIYRIDISNNTQITRDWEQCLKESEISLRSISPSDEQYQEIMKFLYLQQANAMIRNGLGQKARKYLVKCPVSTKVIVLYVMSFFPEKIIFFLKKVYQKVKRIYHPYIDRENFKFANSFYREMLDLK